MKKLLALFLCLLMVASVVIGCSGEKHPAERARIPAVKTPGRVGRNSRMICPQTLISIT